MQYYKLVGDKVELTQEGKEALAILGVTLEGLKDYPDGKLEAPYWQGCKTFVDQALKRINEEEQILKEIERQYGIEIER